MWAQNLGSHNMRPSGIGSSISCLKVSVTLCLVYLTPIALCASWEALPVQCLQLQWVVWECLTNEVWPQPHCIELPGNSSFLASWINTIILGPRIRVLCLLLKVISFAFEWPQYVELPSVFSHQTPRVLLTYSSMTDYLWDATHSHSQWLHLKLDRKSGLHSVHHWKLGCLSCHLEGRSISPRCRC